LGSTFDGINMGIFLFSDRHPPQIDSKNDLIMKAIPHVSQKRGVIQASLRRSETERR
jgi:hypothetical protein